MDEKLRVIGPRAYPDATSAILAADRLAPFPAVKDVLVIRSDRSEDGVRDGIGREVAFRYDDGRWYGPAVVAGEGYLVDLEVDAAVARKYHHKRNPTPPVDFAANVIANHIRTATIEAKRAHHYESFADGSRRRSDWEEPAIRHATKAGEYAAYSGRSLEQWHADLGSVLANSVIRAAFDAKFQSTLDLLATPDDELEDDATKTPNPARRWTSSEVQSLLFDTKNWTLAHAKQWAKNHGFKYGNTDTTDGYHHIRQFDPIRGRPCRTIAMGHAGILARVCSQ